MLTIAGGIILATIFLAAPGFFILAGLLIGALILVVALIAGSWDWILSHIWWIIGFGVVVNLFSSKDDKKEEAESKKSSAEPFV
jgi:hypothetical protein